MSWSEGKRLLTGVMSSPSMLAAAKPQLRSSVASIIKIGLASFEMACHFGREASERDWLSGKCSCANAPVGLGEAGPHEER